MFDLFLATLQSQVGLPLELSVTKRVDLIDTFEMKVGFVIDNRAYKMILPISTDQIKLQDVDKYTKGILDRIETLNKRGNQLCQN